jgi:hypothetical protein
MAGNARFAGVAQSGIPARAIASVIAMSPTEVLRRITAALNEAGIAYMLTGSFASAYHGVPRSTQDIDFVIEATPAQLRAFVMSLPREEYYADVDTALEAQRRRSLFNVIDLATGWKIDLIIRKARAFSQEEFGRRQRVELQNILIFVATAEDIVIAKLEWAKLAASQRQIEDVTAILRMRWESLDHSYLEKWIQALGLTQEWNAALPGTEK